MANIDVASALHTVDAGQLKTLIAEARASARRRSHLLLHAGHDDQVQRLVIAAEPGTYIRPHHHSEQWEMLILLRGVLDVLIFDGQGAVRERQRLDASAPVAQITMVIATPTPARHRRSRSGGAGFMLIVHILRKPL